MCMCVEVGCEGCTACCLSRHVESRLVERGDSGCIASGMRIASDKQEESCKGVFDNGSCMQADCR